jgi:hypothetical protein
VNDPSDPNSQQLLDPLLPLGIEDEKVDISMATVLRTELEGHGLDAGRAKSICQKMQVVAGKIATKAHTDMLRARRKSVENEKKGRRKAHPKVALTMCGARGEVGATVDVSFKSKRLTVTRMHYEKLKELFRCRGRDGGSSSNSSIGDRGSLDGGRLLEDPQQEDLEEEEEEGEEEGDEEGKEEEDSEMVFRSALFCLLLRYKTIQVLYIVHCTPYTRSTILTHYPLY